MPGHRAGDEDTAVIVRAHVAADELEQADRAEDGTSRSGDREAFPAESVARAARTIDDDRSLR